jgi:hypothetical protein
VRRRIDFHGDGGNRAKDSEFFRRNFYGARTMIDPWAKAAECERALRYTDDPHRRILLSQLREYWIAIANEKALGLSDWHTFAETVSDLHRDVVRSLQRGAAT